MAIIDIDMARAASARTIRLARTIADLEGSGQVRRVHVAEALIYRRVAPGLSNGVAPAPVDQAARRRSSAGA